MQRLFSSVFSTLAAFLLCLLFLGTRATSQSPIAKPLPGSYEFPFGTNPYAPSHATAEFQGFLNQSDFPPANYCALCHQEVHAQWRESAHANSFREPFYLKNVQLLINEKGIAYSRHCEGCHNPVALFSGALTSGSKIARPFDEEGISCSVCHSIAGVEDKSGTGSYVMGRPAVMLNPDGSPRPGLPSFSEILAAPELHKKAVMSDLLKTPEFCAACHKASIPAELDGYKWIRAFSVYDEWQQSSWSKQSALPFYQKETVTTCQNCHMEAVSAHDHTATNGTLSSHRFAGANTAIPTFYGYPDQLEAVRNRLRDTLLLDLFRITIDHKGRTTQVSTLGLNAFKIKPGDWITVDLVIQNKGIGHGLVPEQRDFYESWVEFKATDSKSAEIFHSGNLSSDGQLNSSAHSYTNRLLDKGGKLIDLHQVWNTRLKTYDNTIMSGRSDLVRYRFHVPPDARGVIDLAATVRYRRFRKQYSDFILGTSALYPIFDLGSAAYKLRIGNNAEPPGLDPKKIKLRWNNYGIALLGQQQWEKAFDAFSQTTKIDPQYVDGYVNQAIAEYSRWIDSRKEGPDGPGVFSLANANAAPEKFLAALRLLDQAIALKPAYVRALYYKGVILRLQNHLDSAAEQLQEVVRQFPQMRQGHQELGYVFYLKKDYARARDEFEITKQINPDDVTACYYLSLVYPFLKNNAEAAINKQLYSQHRDDPNNYALNVDFVQRHADEARELTPYHVHDK